MNWSIEMVLNALLTKVKWFFWLTNVSIYINVYNFVGIFSGRKRKHLFLVELNVSSLWLALRSVCALDFRQSKPIGNGNCLKHSIRNSVGNVI